MPKFEIQIHRYFPPISTISSKMFPRLNSVLWKHLQEISDNTNETSDNTADQGSLVGGGSTLGWERNWLGDVGAWVRWSVGWWCWVANIGGGAVGVDGGISWLVASTRAVSLSNGGVGHGAGAWAVGDGQGGRLSDRVGLVVLNNGCWVWAVGGVLGNNLSGGELIGTVAVVGGIDGGDGESSDEDGGGTHFEY